MARRRKKPDYISGIHNYCDRWCERCDYTDRCRVCDMDQRERKRRRRKGRDTQSVEAALETVARSFRLARRLIERHAKAEGLDIAELAKGDPDLEAAQARVDRSVKRHPVMRAANRYLKLAHKLIGELADEFNAAADDAQGRVGVMNVVPEAVRLEQVREALDIVAWDHTMIPVKTHRALDGLVEARHEQWPDSREFHLYDGAGSAAVVRKCVARSSTALRELYDWSEDHRDGIIDLLALGDRVRRGLEKLLPGCLTFAWPPRPFEDEEGGEE